MLCLRRFHRAASWCGPAGGTPVMAPSRLGVYWRGKEVQRLLELLQEAGAGEVVMPSTHLRTADLFARAARRLTAEGFPRSGQQCRAKFKRLKASFFEALERWGTSPPAKRRPPFFQLLSRLWEQAERPSWRDRRPAGYQRHQEELEHAMEEAENEHEVSSTESQQVEKNTDGEAAAEENIEEPSHGRVGLPLQRSCDNSSIDNLQIVTGGNESLQIEMVLPTELVTSPLQDNSSIDNLTIVKEEEEAPQMEMALPTDSVTPLLQGPVMFVSIPCTAAVAGSSARVEQFNGATQTISAENMYCKVEKLELSLHQATVQITRLEQEIAQRENHYRSRIDRLEKDNEKMYQEIRSLWDCLHTSPQPTKKRGHL